MPQNVVVPGIGPVQFPDTMTDAQIAAAIKSNLPSKGTPPPGKVAPMERGKPLTAAAPPTEELPSYKDPSVKPKAPGMATQAVKLFPEMAGGAINAVLDIPRRAIEGAKQYQPGSGDTAGVDAVVAPATDAVLTGMGARAMGGAPEGATLGVGPGRIPPREPVATPEVAGDAPSKPFITAQEDKLHNLRTHAEADTIEMRKRIEALPDEIPQMDEKFYHFIENPRENILSPEEMRTFQEHVAPLKQEEDALYRQAKDMGVPAEDLGALDPNYMHRMVKGKSPQFDRLAGGAEANPIYGGRTLSTKSSSMQSTVYHTLEDPETGRRIVVSEYPGKDAVYVYENGRKQGPLYGQTVKRVPETVRPEKYTEGRTTIDRPKVAQVQDGQIKPAYWKDSKEIPDQLREESTSPEHFNKGKLAPGNEFVDMNNKHWNIVRSTTPELEANTTTRYYKSAVANTVDNVLRLRKVVRNQAYLDELKATPEFAQFAIKRGTDQRIPAGWKTPDMPQLQGYYMHPKMANAINDFYRSARVLKGNVADALEKVNRLATGSIFWNPIPHIENVGAHWFVGRGWDNITPSGIKSLISDGTRALKAVVTQNKDYIDALREGSSLISSGVANRNFPEFMLKKMGQEIEKAPQAWDPVAKAFGYTGVPQLIKGIYNGASRVLWQANDAFMLQRMFELEKKGLSRPEAIHEAERHIPNYRIPSEIAGSRALSEIMQDPNLTIFGRYHYGMFKSYAEMVKDLVKGSGPKKFEATGNLAALGFLLFGAYPLMDSAVQALTGNKDAKTMRRGATTIPQAIYDLTTGQKDLTQVLQGILTPSIATQEIAEQFFNRDQFTGQKIGLGGPIQQLYERGKHVAENLIAPIGQAQQVSKNGLLNFLLSQVGVSNPTEKSVAAKKYFQEKDRIEAQKRAKKEPLGWLYGGTQ